ncbi:MAG: MaoC family dehydratase N-terminal domain-containing protein [Myxococcales bacterium]|nr:MaoC family dehydratase N-terminal domain-containing protein [Myxococcales bacterium]
MAKLIDPDRALGHRFLPVAVPYSERDVALYALATGAAEDPSEEGALRRVYEAHEHGQEVLPGFVAVHALNALLDRLVREGSAPGLDYPLARVLHAEQRTEHLAPVAPRGVLSHGGSVSAIFDKGRHAIVVMTVESRDERGVLVARHEIASLVRGGGGFGGPRGDELLDPFPEDREPEVIVEQATHKNQAALFRLLGDANPIHIDRAAVRAFGLPRPILHGMCTLGFALRHVADAVSAGARLASAAVRFADVVFPGETLVTQIARIEDRRVAFRVRAKERNRVVLSHGDVRFEE